MIAWRSGAAGSIEAAATACVLCATIGVVVLGIAWRLYPYEPTQGLMMVLWLMMGRMAAVVALGMLAAESVPESAKKIFWLSLASAYLATLAAETWIVAGWLRRSQSQGSTGK